MVVLAPTVVASKVDVPVLVAVEVAGRDGVAVGVAEVDEIFSSDVLRETSEVVAVVGLEPEAEEDVDTRPMVGESVTSVVLEVTAAAVDVPPVLEVTAVSLVLLGSLFPCCWRVGRALSQKQSFVLEWKSVKL